MRIIYLVCGFFFLGLASIGVFLPLLPTTPFLLISVFFFARSSERWHQYVLNHRIFGQYITDYKNHEMTTGNKTSTLIIMWLGMGLGAYLSGMKPVVVIVLLVIGLATTIHLLSLGKPNKIKRREQMQARKIARAQARAGRASGI